VAKLSLTRVGFARVKTKEMTTWTDREHSVASYASDLARGVGIAWLL